MKEQAKIVLNSFLIVGMGILLILLCQGLALESLGALFLMSVYAYLIVFSRVQRVRDNRLLDLAFLYVVFFAVSNEITRYAVAPQLDPLFAFFAPYFIPIAAAAMLVTLLFNDLFLSFVAAVVTSFSVGLLMDNDVVITMVFFITALVSILLVRGVRHRSQIIRAGLLSGAVQFLCILFVKDFRLDLSMLKSWYCFIPILSGFISGMVVIGLLPIFEYLFNVVTSISLLELADYKHPLLQKMSLEAPGTYHHSLIVSNLAATAAEAIGANSLLARVGAYYHDIGKIEKAGYFIENQMPPFTKHDELAPNMSKLLITNHVREGVELARKFKLNGRLIDFIKEHHGNSLVYYFYVRALEEKAESETLEEEQFRYPGPKPQSKETAIVLLADSVEAASRSLDDPTAASIEELTHKIINNKFIDGQLDECDLTLRDLEVIAKVFVRILIGIYHARIKYPGKKGADADFKKHSDKDSSSSHGTSKGS